MYTANSMHAHVHTRTDTVTRKFLNSTLAGIFLLQLASLTAVQSRDPEHGIH